MINSLFLFIKKYKHTHVLSIALLVLLVLTIPLTVLLSKEGKNDEAKAATTTITIDPTADAGVVNPLIWGINGPGREIWKGDSPIVEQRIADAKIKLVRVGGVQYSNFYLNNQTCTAPTVCNFTIMDQVMTSVFRSGAEPLFMFATYPGGFAEGDYSSYAQFMAGVVRHYNVDLAVGKKIRYWEVWNEPSDPIDGQFTKDNYMQFVRTVASAMKAVDPTIKIVAPAMSWNNLDPGGWVHTTAQQTNDLVDVLSWHNYARHGDAQQARFDKSKKDYHDDIILVKTSPDYVSPTGKRYGAAITEYNMAGQPLADGNNELFRTNYNAAFAATVLIHAAKAQAEFMNFFILSQQGANHLGLLDYTNNWEPYKPYYTFHLFGNHTGERYVPGSLPGNSIDYLASKSQDGKTLYIIAVNKDTVNTQTLSFQLPSTLSGNYQRYVLDANTNPTSSSQHTYTNGIISYDLLPTSVVAFDIHLSDSPIASPTATPIASASATPISLPTSTPMPTATPTPLSTNGLQGAYFANKTLSGIPSMTRIDQTINFDWGKTSPDVSLPADQFSVRWTGYVIPLYSQTYTFYTQSDDGVRLWINGKRLVNNWTNHSVRQNSGKITLTAGKKYPITLDYYENTNDAIIKLLWSSSSTLKQIIPQSQLMPF